MKQRTPLITVALLASLLTACSKHSADTASASGLQRQPVFSIAFTNGSSRDDILHQLVQEHAKVLKDSPELVRAEFQTPKMTTPMEVELNFSDGKLTKTTEIRQ